MNSVFKSIVGFLPVGLCTILVTGAILWLTLAPHPLPESDMPVIPGMDKVVHGCMFGGLYFILAFDALLWRIGKKRTIRRLVTGRMAVVFALACVAFGGGIELAQGTMGLGRGCDFWDFVADAAGVAFAVWLTPAVLKQLAFSV